MIFMYFFSKFIIWLYFISKIVIILIIFQSKNGLFN